MTPHRLHRWLGTSLLLATAALAAAQTPDPELMQNRQKFSTQTSKQAELGYLLYLPPGYDAKAEKKWPLILFLHGAGERGTNLAQVSVHGPPKLVKKNPPAPKNETDEARASRETATKLAAEKFIIVSPQCPTDQIWDTDAVLGLLDSVIAKHKVDASRVYLTGLSMGGYGSWALLAKAPERFAAIAPICGGGNTIDFLLPGRGKAAALKATPVWAFHGAKDPVVLLAESERLVALLKKLGVKDVQLTVYPEAQHDSWTATYNNPKLYEWFLSHERK
jgi:predicted peptidase